MWDGMKSLTCFVLGLILTVIGVIPLLNQWKIIGFGLPSFVAGLVSAIIIWLIAGSGIFLLIEAFMEGLDDDMAKVLLVVGILVLAIGLIPLLNSFGVIAFTVPFLSLMLFQIIFTIEGILMVIGAFRM